MSEEDDAKGVPIGFPEGNFLGISERFLMAVHQIQSPVRLE